MEDKIQQRFEEAVSRVDSLADTPTDHELLELYSLYKQAMEGDNNRTEPWRIQIREHRKWSAWESLRGMHPRDAANDYATLVEKLESVYGRE